MKTSPLITFEPLSLHQSDTFRDRFVARTAVHKPQNGEDPWPAPKSDAERITPLVKHELDDTSPGNVPFLDILNARALNKLLGEQPDDPEQMTRITLLERSGASPYATAIVSPNGGFIQETLRRLFNTIITRQDWTQTVPFLRTEKPAHTLYIASLQDPLSYAHTALLEKENRRRSLTGAMAAYHALGQLPAEATIQYGFLHYGQTDSHRNLLLGAMGLQANSTKIHVNHQKSFTVSWGKVGKSDQSGTVLHSLAAHIQASHSIVEQ